MEVSRALASSGKASGFTPDYFANSVTDIDFAKLKQKGIVCLILDVDHTLAPHGSIELPQKTIDYLNQQLDKQNIAAIFIASNSRRNLSDLATSINANVIRPGRLKRKPSRGYRRRILKATGYSPAQSVMVGDKLINDIWGGNRSGMHTILVPPIGPDLLFDKLVRRRFWARRYLRKKR